jgi:hypothetical protein
MARKGCYFGSFVTSAGFTKSKTCAFFLGELNKEAGFWVSNGR